MTSSNSTADIATLAGLVTVLGEELYAIKGDATARPWRRLTTDSRVVGEGDVFVALTGERHDGHDHVAGAAVAGAVCVIVERPIELPAGADTVELVVRNTRRALGRIARAWRANCALPLVAVGGSNGKTTSTQMVAAVLRAHFGDEAVHATKGNFNNDIGVPQTLLGLKATHRAAVVETGMNHRGEMAYLADMVRPTVALLTNAQREHQAYLETVAETASENGLLIAALPDSGCAVFPADDPCADVWASLALARGVRTFTYSFDEKIAANVYGQLNAEGVLTLTGAVEATIPLTIAGQHNARNATGAALVAKVLGLDWTKVTQALSNFHALAGRGARETVETPSGAFTLVDDAYNCNPDSAIASLKTLANAKAPRVFLFGDMGELGASSEAWHREVGRTAKSLGIDYFWCAGASHAAGAAADAFGVNGSTCRAYADRETLIAALRDLPLDGATVVVKASHSAGFTHVIEALRAFGKESQQD